MYKPVLPWTVILFIGLSVTIAYGAQNQDSGEFKIRIAVEEIRLDAVVVDGKGRQINDLTADDFEIYQDDQPQKVVSSIYVSDFLRPLGKPALAPKGALPLPRLAAPMPKQEEVRRVIAFVLDDLSMSFENFSRARMSLQRFVENQMQPGDMVAILRTSMGMSAFQMFVSDRHQLQTRVENIRWNGNVGREFTANDLHPLFDGQLSAVRYCIRALSKLPGRKALVLVSTQPGIPGSFSRDSIFVDNIDYQSLYMRAYNRIADEALRAGVVIHFLDIRGLRACFPGPGGIEQGSGTGGSPGSQPECEQIQADNIDALNPLPQKTGGIYVTNSNFFLKGIGEVNDALQGYYILSYIPPETTFRSRRTDIYHRIKIKVKRSGATVYTRDGFLGVLEQKEEPEVAEHPLREAVFSPFQNSDLKVHLASGYIDDPKTGYVIRSWLHLDPENVTITKKEEGHFVALETVCVTSDINGYIQDANIMKYQFRIKEESLAWVQKNGIRFSLFLPVKKPGAYYLRAGVKDEATGKVGSAYQFIEIPDLKKGRLALSNLFLVSQADEVAWVRSGLTAEVVQSVLHPILRRVETRSPALRTYFPGDHFEYMSVIYNAKHDKTRPPEIESQFVLYKDGIELIKSDSQPIALADITDFERIPIMRRMVLNEAIQPGDYALQVVVRDNKRRGDEALASQTLSFDVQTKVSKPEGDPEPRVEPAAGQEPERNPAP